MKDLRSTARHSGDNAAATPPRDDARAPLPPPRLLWFAFLGAPVVWAANLLLGYAIQATACDAWNNPAVARVLPALCSLVAAAVAVVAVVVALRVWRGTGVGEENPEAEVSAAVGRTWFMSYGGLLTSLLFLLAIILTGVVELTATPCSWV